jgi:hypothetical protein
MSSSSLPLLGEVSQVPKQGSDVWCLRTCTNWYVDVGTDYWVISFASCMITNAV